MNHFPKYLKLSVLVFSFFLVVTRTMVFDLALVQHIP
jgi:hypothetical protein